MFPPLYKLIPDYYTGAHTCTSWGSVLQQLVHVPLLTNQGWTYVHVHVYTKYTQLS